MENLILKRVTHTDVEFLYEFLKQRKNYENISHTKMPTFKQHVKFINSIPYSKWYVILCDSEKIGSIYLSKQNEIGIHIKNNFDNFELKKEAIKILMEKNPRHTYFANVSMKNKNLMKFFESLKFTKLQITYEFNTLFNSQNKSKK